MGNNSSAAKNADDRMKAFMMQITTPSTSKPTKKIKYAKSSQIQTVHAANSRLLTNTKNTTKNISDSKNITSDTKTAPPRSALQPLHRQSQRKTLKAPKDKSFPIPNPKPQTQTMAQSQKCSKSSKPNSASPQNPAQSQSQSKSQIQSALDQYSLSLQMKNAECEQLKAQISKVISEKEQFESECARLKGADSEASRLSSEVRALQSAVIARDGRICELERKLESCGIDPIALASREFMDEDTQKHMLFWRQRLSNARQKLDARRKQQRENVATARYYLKQLEQWPDVHNGMRCQ